MKIAFDPSADAMYVRLTSPTEAGSGSTEVDDAGVIVDTDAYGNPRGFEFLNVRSLGISTETLPMYVAANIQRFIADGHLNTHDPVEINY